MRPFVMCEASGFNLFQLFYLYKTVHVRTFMFYNVVFIFWAHQLDLILQCRMCKTSVSLATIGK